MAALKVLGGVLAAAAASEAVPHDSATKPNIVWVMSDDMGWGEPGAYPSTGHGGLRISTPHLDEFAKTGLQFTNAYAGYTVCAPSRTTLMTGRHSGQFVKYGYPGTTLASGAAVTTQMLLQKAGYATAGVGKMAPLHDPVPQGFEYFIGQVDQGLCHNMYPLFYDSGTRPETKPESCSATGFCNIELSLNAKIPANASAARTACMANPSEFNYTVDITAHHSLAFVSDHVAKNPSQPFFLYEAFTVPHAGGWGKSPNTPESGAPVPSDGEYAVHTDWPDVERDHAAVITYLDAYVGDLMTLLKKLSIEDKTLVFFASDNGAHLEGGHSYHFFNSTGGLLGHKRSLYEGGMRSPTMARWPGTITPGVSDFAWAFWDFMPTVAELAGATGDIPKDIDGISIVPTLMGKTQPDKDYLYWTWDGTGVPPLPEGWTMHQDADGLAVYRNVATQELTSTHPSDENEVGQKKEKGGTPGYAVRVGEWKGVVPHCDDEAGKHPSTGDLDVMEIYHLPTDPFETENLASTSAGKSKATELLQVILPKNLTCSCYQC
jgi:arylsulfatase A-like enzyme